jgi:hypothetical protein
VPATEASRFDEKSLTGRTTDETKVDPSNRGGMYMGNEIFDSLPLAETFGAIVYSAEREDTEGEVPRS